ncbi:hypothetical protein ACFX13_025135 [Malus domestica]
MIDLECDSPLAFGSNPDPDIRIGVQYGGGFWVRNYESFRSKGYGNSSEKFNPKLISKPGGSNGVGSRSGFNQKFRGGLHSNGVGLEDLGGSSVRKGVDDPIEAMTCSIEFLGEVFVKMEKRKMEMAKEMEKMRMKMEMKQNQMIMESQKQIVDGVI